MPAFYRLQVITPQGVPYSGEVIHSLVPGERGFVGILANHAAYVTSSAGGRLEVKEKDGAVKRFKVGAGFFEIRDNQASFLTESFDAQPSA